MANDNETLSLIDGTLSLKFNDLSNPVSLEKTFLDLKSLLKNKRVIGTIELNILLEKEYSKEDIAEKISDAILIADTQQALNIWNMCAADLKYTIILPDVGNINLGIIEKFELEWDEIRKAFMSKKNFLLPKQTAYTTVFGDYSYEDAEELAYILEQLWNSGLYGKVTVQEFFHEIDLRILYLLGIREIEQFLEEGGEDVHLALKTNDQLPVQLNLLAWIQSRMPEKYNELVPELLNPIYPENRNMFWETHFRMNLPHIGADYYSQKEEQKARRTEDKNSYGNNGEESEDERYENELDDYLKDEEE